MPLFHPAIVTSLLVLGLPLLGVVASQAIAANECPCIATGNSCVRDLACEERRGAEGQARERAREEAEPYRQRGRGGLDFDGRVKSLNPTITTPSATPIPSPASRPVQPNLDVRARTPAPRGADQPLALPGSPQSGKGQARNGSPSPAGTAPAASDDRPPAAADGRSPASVPKGSERAAPASPRLRILETGYSHLSEFGKEAPGYGLYSYAILPSDSERAARFLAEVFREIPAIGDTSAQPSQLNIFYVPLRKDKEADFTAMLQTSRGDAAKLGAEYTKSFYDYRMARGLLDHICNPPDPSVLDLCNGDLSRGPYIFAYASAASHIEPVPPPYLFVDLSDVHERAFGEFLAAFQAQVKREDVSDQAKIKTLRLRILNIALTAADWVGPVQKAVADIARSAAGDDKK